MSSCGSLWLLFLIILWGLLWEIKFLKSDGISNSPILQCSKTHFGDGETEMKQLCLNIWISSLRYSKTSNCWKQCCEDCNSVVTFVNSIQTFGIKFCFISLTAKVPADFSYFWTIQILKVQNIYAPEEEALFMEFFHFLFVLRKTLTLLLTLHTGNYIIGWYLGLSSDSQLLVSL